MSQELCPDVEMGLFEPAVLASASNELLKLPQKSPRGRPLSLCLGCVPPSPVGAIALPGRVATLAPVQATDGPITHCEPTTRKLLRRGTWPGSGARREHVPRLPSSCAYRVDEVISLMPPLVPR
jgi:hypothetical protein